MERWSCMASTALPLAAMVAVEFADVSITSVSKAAMKQGMSNFVFVVYYKALSTIIILPFFLCRKKQASITINLFFKFFLLGLSGSAIQMLYYTGVKYSSPTLSSALGNLVPVYTYLLAIIFRMEEPNLRSASGQAKLWGALISISGALTVTLYQGQLILHGSGSGSSSNLESSQKLLQPQQSNWVIGGLLLAAGNLVVALMNIFQTSVVKEFPEKITIVFFLCFFTSILSGGFTLIVERNPNAWKLKPDIELIAITYSAILGGVLRSGVLAWCLHEKGPFYVAMFRPLGIAIAVVTGVVFLRDPLYIGSLIGAVIITMGFYAVMWGKANEQSVLTETEVCSMETSWETTPLLQNKPKEDV